MSDQPKNIGVSEDIESNSFRFYHLFNLIYDYKKLNISILCLSLFLSILYFQLAPSIYTASTLLVPTIGNLSQVDPVENILDNLDNDIILYRFFDDENLIKLMNKNYSNLITDFNKTFKIKLWLVKKLFEINIFKFIL